MNVCSTGTLKSLFLGSTFSVTSWPSLSLFSSDSSGTQFILALARCIFGGISFAMRLCKKETQQIQEIYFNKQTHISILSSSAGLH
jgi:Na+/H+ antiporter NhaA